MSEEKIILPFA